MIRIAIERLMAPVSTAAAHAAPQWMVYDPQMDNSRERSG
jgi:hypothetical protein